MIENIGEFVKAKRSELGLTQVELANMLNITDKAVSKWERGLSYPDVALLPKIAEVFKVSVEELIHGKISSMEKGNLTVEISLQDRKEKALKIFTIVAIAITITGVFVTFLINFAILGKLTWALYVAAGFALLWAAYLPIRLMKNKMGKYVAVVFGAIGAWLYCFLVQYLTGTSGWATALALPIILTAFVTTNLTLISIEVFKTNKFLQSSATFFLNGVVLNLVVNMLIKNYLVEYQKSYNFYDALGFGIISLVFLAIGIKTMRLEQNR